MWTLDYIAFTTRACLFKFSPVAPCTLTSSFCGTFTTSLTHAERMRMWLRTHLRICREEGSYIFIKIRVRKIYFSAVQKSLDSGVNPVIKSHDLENMLENQIGGQVTSKLTEIIFWSFYDICT